MASPQTKNGHTRIAHEIVEKIAMTDLNGTQLRIVMIIWRYTYGFSRKEHEMSLAFLAEKIGSTKSHAERELTSLINRRMVNVVGIGSRRGRILSFNKNYDEWDKPIEQPATEPEQPKKKPQKKPKYDEDNTYYKMAVYFHGLVANVAKDAGVEHLVKKTNLQSWADDFRKLVDVDKVDRYFAKEVMDWVTKDNFWRTNVLSAKKFREKFTELAIKMKASQTPRQQQPIPQNPQLNIRDKEIAFQQWVTDGNDPNEFKWI